MSNIRTSNVAAQIIAAAARINDLALQLTVEKPPSELLIRYSQNDPRWASLEYAGGLSFASAGCYVTCVAMLATWGGSKDTPPQTAAKLRMADCFAGANLSRPQNIPKAYPFFEWPAGAYWNRAGSSVPTYEMQLIRDYIIAGGPLILKVDYKPENYKYNMHFILAVDVIGDDLEIIDPIDGYRGAMLPRYGTPRGWTIEQAIFGYRRLRVKT